MSRQKRLGTEGENRIVQAAQKRGLKARKQPLSGQLRDYPADVVLQDTVLVESKVRAVAKSQPGERYVRLNLDWLEKVIQEAQGAGYAMGVVVLQPKGTRKKYTLVDFETFLSLLASQ